MNSEEEIENQYVLIEIGSIANEKNNLLPSPVAMSTGEANYVNDFLKSNPSSTQRYQIIEENVS
tara:strand:+ start:330 stop:521 length:192 start_codon:yes stop_codon:yes gene_type:complete